MACTITDKEKEVLANAGFKPSPFGDWDSPNFQGKVSTAQYPPLFSYSPASEQT